MLNEPKYWLLRVVSAGLKVYGKFKLLLTVHELEVAEYVAGLRVGTDNKFINRFGGKP